jgi:hypothetical protein
MIRENLAYSQLRPHAGVARSRGDINRLVLQSGFDANPKKAECEGAIEPTKLSTDR